MAEEFDVLIVLGAPNDAEGRLSPIALGRTQRALEAYRERPGLKFVLGGGFGERFNTTNRPHAYYVAQHLIRSGVSPDDILGFAEGSNTVEEAVLARRLLADRGVRRVCVVTSDFHCARAGVIYRHVFPEHEVSVLSAAVPLTPEERMRRETHETEALRQIERQGGVILPPSADHGACKTPPTG